MQQDAQSAFTDASDAREFSLRRAVLRHNTQDKWDIVSNVTGSA